MSFRIVCRSNLLMMFLHTTFSVNQKDCWHFVYIWSRKFFPFSNSMRVNEFFFTSDSRRNANFCFWPASFEQRIQHLHITVRGFYKKLRLVFMKRTHFQLANFCRTLSRFYGKMAVERKTLTVDPPPPPPHHN